MAGHKQSPASTTAPSREFVRGPGHARPVNRMPMLQVHQNPQITREQAYTHNENAQKKQLTERAPTTHTQRQRKVYTHKLHTCIRVHVHIYVVYVHIHTHLYIYIYEPTCVYMIIYASTWTCVCPNGWFFFGAFFFGGFFFRGWLVSARTVPLLQAVAGKI